MELKYKPDEQQIKDGRQDIKYYGRCNICFNKCYTSKCNTCVFYVCAGCEWKLKSKHKQYIKSTQKIDEVQLPICPQCKELFNYKDILNESERMVLRMRQCIKNELEGIFEIGPLIHDDSYPDPYTAAKAYQELDKQCWLKNGPDVLEIQEYEDTILFYKTMSSIIFETYKDKNPQVIEKYESLFGKQK